MRIHSSPPPHTRAMIAIRTTADRGYVLYISHTKNDYTPPPIPVDLPVFTGRVEFGLPMKEKHFLLDVSVPDTCMSILAPPTKWNVCKENDVGHFIAYSF